MIFSTVGTSGTLAPIPGNLHVFRMGNEKNFYVYRKFSVIFAFKISSVLNPNAVIIFFKNSFHRYSELRAVAASTTTASTGRSGPDAERRQRQRQYRWEQYAEAGKAKTSEDRLLQRTADALGRIVHGQPVPEQGPAYRSRADAKADGETDQDMVPEQAYEREKVQKRFR